MTKAAAWMQARGWKEKLAKRRGYEQSLFEHSLIELDVLLELLPILGSPRHYSLSENEEAVLVIAVLAHDIGKETDAWQVYIRDPRPDRWVPDILPELTRAVIPEVCATLGFSKQGEAVERIMAHCVNSTTTGQEEVTGRSSKRCLVAGRIAFSHWPIWSKLLTSSVPLLRLPMPRTC